MSDSRLLIFTISGWELINFQVYMVYRDDDIYEKLDCQTDDSTHRCCPSHDEPAIWQLSVPFLHEWQFWDLLRMLKWYYGEAVYLLAKWYLRLAKLKVILTFCYDLDICRKSTGWRWESHKFQVAVLLNHHGVLNNIRNEWTVRIVT